MSEKTGIKICANGGEVALAETTPLPDFLSARGFRKGQVVVEYNGSALTPREAEAVILRDGDSLEIVRIVAGG